MTTAPSQDVKPARWALTAAPAAAAVAYILLQQYGFTHAMAGTAAVTVWMAVWWITEVVDLGVTSLIPILAFPLLGILDASDVARQYMEQTIFLFIGGFYLAYAMEKWNLHQRLAYSIIRKAGSTPTRILAGIMITTFIVSMWISNTATTIMMITSVLAIIRHENLFDKKAHKTMAVGYLLALTYTASIGGMGTLVGTPTNMILSGFFDKMYPDQPGISFNRWMFMAFPLSVGMAVLTYFIIRHRYFKKEFDKPFDSSFLREQHEKLGSIRYEEKVVLAVFLLAVMLWFTRTGIDFGTIHFRGWSGLWPGGKLAKDSTVALLAAFLLFLIPSRKKEKSGILVWEDVSKLPFRIILLFGSGFALAEAFRLSGLADKVSGQLSLLSGMPVWIFLLAIAALVTLLSEFASNVASIQLMLPILAPLAVSLQVDPIVIMMPATLAASFGYMMPVATAPNTIVYGTGYVPVKEMMRTGLILNIAGIILLTIYFAIFHT